jgi:hypothetical protein
LSQLQQKEALKLKKRDKILSEIKKDRQDLNVAKDLKTRQIH